MKCLLKGKAQVLLKAALMSELCYENPSNNFLNLNTEVWLSSNSGPLWSSPLLLNAHIIIPSFFVSSTLPRKVWHNAIVCSCVSACVWGSQWRVCVCVCVCVSVCVRVCVSVSARLCVRVSTLPTIEPNNPVCGHTDTMFNTIRGHNDLIRKPSGIVKSLPRL